MKVNIHRVAIVEYLPSHFTLELNDNATFTDLVDCLTANYNDQVKAEIMTNGQIREGVLILVNGRSITKMGGAKSGLKNGDDILITVMVCGG